jgi:putative sterol carrier protein
MSQVSEIFDKLPSIFNAEVAKGMDAIFQYDISGDQGGAWNVIVKDGKCEVHQGIHPSPTVTMKMDVPTYLAIASKELNGMQAFMTGKLKISGNVMLAQKFPQIFPG